MVKYIKGTIMMLKNIYTNKQLSLFFQIAVFLNFLCLVSNILLYSCFPESPSLKFIATNLSNLSLFMICIIIIPKIVLYIINKYKKFIDKYTFLAIPILIVIITFLFLILKLDSKTQEKIVIFFSNLLRITYNQNIVYIALSILLIIIVDVYHNFIHQKKINTTTIFTILYDVFMILIRRYLIILLTLFTIFNIKQLTYFQSNILHYSASFFLDNLTFLIITIPLIWLILIVYFIYYRFLKNR